MANHARGIESRLMRNGLAWVFGRTAERESLRPVEGGGFAFFADLVRIDLFMKKRPSE